MDQSLEEPVDLIEEARRLEQKMKEFLASTAHVQKCYELWESASNVECIDK
ncbi:MAG: hypothetical protein RL235_128 [Chlamydiota bacterium]|jgi:hypothetical protein